MLFASELNISNGNPYTRDYGERGMFDKLESAESIFNRWDEYDAETVYTEVYRLLFGPFKKRWMHRIFLCKSRQRAKYWITQQASGLRQREVQLLGFGIQLNTTGRYVIDIFCLMIQVNPR